MYIFAYPAMARHAFKQAAEPVLNAWDYATGHYPGKTVAVTSGIADLSMIYQHAATDNPVGVAAFTVSLAASVFLFAHGDPKITQDQAATHVDPQDQRNIWSWIKHPTKYPWETTALLKMGASIGWIIASANLSRYGELASAFLSLTAFTVKIGVRERAKDSMYIPPARNFFKRRMQRVKKYVRENPNPTAAHLWNASLVALGAEAVELVVTRNDYGLFVPIALYAVPNTLTLFSSKRAKVLSSAPK